MQTARSKRAQIDAKLAELRQMTYFAMRDYDYHHKNDEQKILDELQAGLDEAHPTLSQFLAEHKALDKYLDSMEENLDKFDKEILEIVEKFSLSKDLIAGRSRADEINAQAGTAVAEDGEANGSSACQGQSEDKENTKPKPIVRGQMGRSSSYEDLCDLED